MRTKRDVGRGSCGHCDSPTVGGGAFPRRLHPPRDRLGAPSPLGDIGLDKKGPSGEVESTSTLLSRSSTQGRARATSRQRVWRRASDGVSG